MITRHEFFALFADVLIANANDAPSDVVVTKSENVLCNRDIDLRGLRPCFQEEADTRMFLPTCQ